MGMTSMNVSLPADLKKYVEQRSRKGYSTPSEYVRELIREDRKRDERHRLESLLLEGLESGQPVEATPQFWDGIKREALEKIAKRRK